MLISVTQLPGIPSFEGYYSSQSRYESPLVLFEGERIGNVIHHLPKEQLDWWNVTPYKNISPFSEWD